MTAPLRLSPEVAAARAAGRAIGARDSTSITHGMSFPQNLATARAVEAEVRAAGAVPATVAVAGGVIEVGLAPDRLAALAETRDARKLSRADLAVALAMGWTGATTVAATMIAARLAGIAVFATGGIGGVHRGAETSFDISADLEELAQTPGHRGRLRREGDSRSAQDPSRRSRLAASRSSPTARTPCPRSGRATAVCARRSGSTPPRPSPAPT